MKRFESHELEAAIAHAADGGQALHVHRFVGNRHFAPRIFVREIDAGREIAHLFDRDIDRLIATARGLGVRAIKVGRQGTPKQHIDLCAAPLRAALAMAESEMLMHA